MTQRGISWAAAALLSIVGPVDASAFLAGGAVDLVVQVVVNEVERAPLSACEVSGEIEVYRKDEIRFTIAAAKSHPVKGWEGTGSGIRCGTSSEPAPPLSGSAGSSYFVAEGQTVSRLSRRMEDERILEVAVSLSLQQLLGFDDGGRPIYEGTELERKFVFSESRDAFVPLFVANEAERNAFGIHEVYLRVAARVDAPPSRALYGVVSVVSSVANDELLMDGGVVATASPTGETILRNVPVGYHELGVRDSSGRETRKVVQVEGGRSVRVDLRLPEAGAADTPYRLEPLGTNAQGYEEYQRANDGAVVVRVPAGEFLMGNEETERTPLEHRVYVSEFLMDKTGATWGQFKRFVEATGLPLPLQQPYWGLHDDHPAVYVTWEDSKAYCEWAGGRLPTEAEREKAARGTDARKYPWGNEEPDAERGVHRRSWGHEATGPVGTHPAGVSPYGLHDMGGNVWEWCSDWYGEDYYAASPYRDPKGPASGTAHVVRGGSWDSRPTVLSSSCRSWGHQGYRDGDFGFRCAMDAPP